MSQSKIGELVMLGERVTGVVMLDDKAYDLSAIKQLLSNQIPEGHISVPIDIWEVLCERELERDALAAKTNALNSLIVSIQNAATEYLQPDGDTDDFIDRVIYLVDGPGQRAAQANAQQCLLDIQAEAGRAGWNACVDWLVENSSADLFTDGEADQARDVGKEYAESVRKGGAE